jgi:hypothetical protein
MSIAAQAMSTRLRADWVLTALLAVSTLIAAPVQAQEPVGEPREVKISLLMTDLTEVDGAAQAFSADVFLLATWEDPELADDSAEIRTFDLNEVWHPTLLIYNRRSVRESLPQEVIVYPDGTVTYLQRFIGQFSIPMDLQEFPRDRQEFFVWVISPTRAGANVSFVPDESVTALRTRELSISDWELGQPRLTIEALQVASGAQANPGIKLTLPGSRRVTYYIIQVLIPLVAIVMMAYAVFWIAPSVVPTRVGTVVTTMLTLIAYRFMLGNHVPRLPYLTRLDWFMLGATVLVMITLVAMAGTSYLIRREQEAIVNKVDRAGRLLYPLVFAAFSAIVWLG